MFDAALSSKRLALLVLSVAALSSLAIPAALAGGPTRSMHAGWWWAAQASPRVAVPVPQGAEPGSIFVSRHAGAHEKAAAVWIDVADLTAAPESLVVTLDELDGPSAPGGTLLACPVVDRAWTPAQGGLWAARALGDCRRTETRVGSRSPDGTWTFDLTAMAGSWVTGALPNFGFELVPARSLRAPAFEIGLHAPDADDLHLITAAGAPATAVEGELATSPNEVSTVAAPPLTGGAPTAVRSPWSLARRTGPSTVDAVTPAGPTPAPNTPQAAPDRIELIDTASHREAEAGSSPSLALLAFAVLVGATALMWRRVRPAVQPSA